MGTTNRGRIYRHGEVGLLRAAATPMSQAPARWPDIADAEACREWLLTVWSSPEVADAIRLASPGLADRVDAICAGDQVSAKQIRRAAESTVRYVLRATGRHTPFGLFAGVAPVTVGPRTSVPWGDRHSVIARVDAQWLTDVIDALESDSELLDRLDVVFNNLAVRRGAQMEMTAGPSRVVMRYTAGLEAVRDAAGAPVRFGELVVKLAEAFPGADPLRARDMLTELVQQRFLLTCLRAPTTVVNPLDRLVDRLDAVDAESVPSVAPRVDDLRRVQADLDRHNLNCPDRADQARLRAGIVTRMHAMSNAGRTPLAVDTRVDCEVQVPDQVAREMALAAGALARLTRQPTGEAAWREYYVAFHERYGVGTLVPLADVVDPESGLGPPAGYAGSVMPTPTDIPPERDALLLTMAWSAAINGDREIVLSEEIIDSLTVGGSSDKRRVPPHVEVAARVHATSAEAVDRGDFALTIAPARSAGTFTSRFTTVATGSGLESIYATVPTGTKSALPVQLSFPPVYPHAENVCRVPTYLPHVLPLGEHRGVDDAAAMVPLEDLAITATRERLLLVSVSRQRVVEPQVFHALALDKQAPPMARFLAHLPRALVASWHEFDWGETARNLPYLPRVRYRRSVLSPARWRLQADDIPSGASEDAWRSAFQQWRQRWRCPSVVELRDGDRALRLALDEPAHVAIVRAHVKRYGHATLTETAKEPTEFGWLGGHTHEVVLPMFAVAETLPAPRIRSLAEVSNADHGHFPGSEGAEWLSAKIFTHPERIDEIISAHLATLTAALGHSECWFVRYRSAIETDHLRLRVRIADLGGFGRAAATVSEWARRLRAEGLMGRLAYDTYFPEVGRYGRAAALTAAEDVFIADSHVVMAQLGRLPAADVDPLTLTALNMLGTAEAFLGGLDQATQWLTAQPAPDGTADRDAVKQAVELARNGTLDCATSWHRDVVEAWEERAAALTKYRAQLPEDADTGPVLEALLHMHHNRALGIDRGRENSCRRLARQTALSLRARRGGDR